MTMGRENEILTRVGPGTRLDKGGYPGLRLRTSEQDDIHVDRDVAVKMRDGQMKRGKDVKRAWVIWALLALASSPLFAQTWPSKPIRMIVAAPVGSPIEVPARVVADRLRERLGQPVLVDARPGAGGIIGTDAVAKSSPDGYTLLASFSGPLAYAPFLYSKLAYDPQRDFAPILRLSGQPFLLGVPASLGIKDLREFIELAKKNPGKFNYASVGSGSGAHVAMELLMSRAGISLVHVPYPAGTGSVEGLVSGDVQAFFAPVAMITGQARAGKVTLLAVSTAKRFTLLPNVPTVAEQGFPDFDADGWTAVLAPAGTPRPIVDRLNKDINAILALPEVRQQLSGALIRIDGGSQEELARWMLLEANRWGPVIKATGVKLD